MVCCKLIRCWVVVVGLLLEFLRWSFMWWLSSLLFVLMLLMVSFVVVMRVFLLMVMGLWVVCSRLMMMGLCLIVGWCMR